MPAPSTSLFFSGNIAWASGLNRDRRVKITDAHQGSRTWNAMSIPSYWAHSTISYQLTNVWQETDETWTVFDRRTAESP